MRNVLLLGVLGFSVVGLLGCGGGSGGGGGSKPSSSVAAVEYKITTQTNTGGSISPASTEMKSGETKNLVISPDPDFFIQNVSGCNGQLNQNSYSLANITADCVVNVEFARKSLQGMKIYWQESAFPDGSSIRLASIAPESSNLKAEDFSFSIASHLQYLLVANGESFESSESLIRQYLNLYTGESLSLISKSVAESVNTKFSALKNETEVGVDSLMALVSGDISENSALEFRNRLKLEYEFSLSSDFIDLNNTSRKLTIASAASDEINSAYEVVWQSYSWVLIETSSNKAVVEPTIVGDDTVLFTVVDKADKSIKYSQHIPVKSIKTETIIPVLNEDTGNLEIINGLSVESQDAVAIPSGWNPSFYADIGSGELINLDVSDLSTVTEFSFNYDPVIVPNPKLLQFSVTKDNDEFLIQPSDIDFTNHVVKFSVNPSLFINNSQKQSSVNRQQKQSNSDKLTVHVKVSEKQPTGEDIDDLLDGKQHFIELAIAEMFKGVTHYKDPNKKINNYNDAKNKFALDYYSKNDSVRQIARAKLTKYLQVTDAKGYSRYKEFSAAINMAVADQVIKTIKWSNVGVTKWYDNKCALNIGLPTINCVSILKDAYAEGPQLMNEGISAFIGHTKLSSNQMASVGIFKAIASLGVNRPSSKGDFYEFAATTGLATFDDYQTAADLLEYGIGVKNLVTGSAFIPLAATLAVGKFSGKTSEIFESSLITANTVKYTPLIYALKAHSNSVLETGMLNENEHIGWTRGGFKNLFLASEPHKQLISHMQRPKTSGGSRFGELDPASRMDGLLLGGLIDNDVPTGWSQRAYVSNEARYAAFKFMLAAFGATRYQSEITNIATQSLKLAVAPPLIASQSIGISEVAGADFLIDPARDGSRPLIIKSKYRGEGGLVCELLGGAKFDDTSSWKCKNGFQLQKFKNKLSKQGMADSLSFENYKNIVGANELFDKLRLTVSPAGHKKLSAGSLIESIEIEVKGHKLNKNNGFVDLAERVSDYSKSSGLINANLFEYDSVLELYYLPLGKVFPELKSSTYNNNLLAIGVTIKVSNSGVKKQASHALVYSTLTDESLLVDDLLPKEKASGRVTYTGVANVGVGGVTVVLQPGNKIAITDSEGYFDFGNVPYGSYTLSANIPESALLEFNSTELVKVELSIRKDMKIPKISEQVKISDQKFADCLDATGARFPDELMVIQCEGVSVNGDELREFKNLILIHLFNSNIYSADWSYFKLLSSLQLNNVPIDNLDLDSNENLRNLLLVNNGLKSIDLSALTELDYLVINENDIDRINLSSNKNLTYLSIYKTKIESLNLQRLDKLEQVQVAWNKLKELSLGNHPKLKELTAAAINYPNDAATGMIINNELTSVDVTGCPSLEHLNLNDNLIGDIDLSNNPKLKYLGLRKRGAMFDGDVFQGIHYLDLKNLTDLEEIYLSGHALASLDLSGNTNLVKLDAAGTSLSSLDVSMLNKLTYLSAMGANLTSIDIRNLVNLKELFIANNKIASLDLSNNPVLERVEAYNNKLTSVTGIENLSKSTFIHLSENMFDRDALIYFNDLRNNGYTKLYASSVLKSSSSASSSSSVSLSSRSSSSKSSASSIGNHSPLEKSAWVASESCHWANPLCDSWLVFLDESNYFSIQTAQPDDGCTVGVEKGTYARSAVTGAFQVSPQFDGNNHCGVSDAGAGATLVLNGNQLSYKEVANSAPIGFVKAASGSMHLGAWIISENNHTEVLALADTTFIRAIYKNGVEDVELGYYSYNQSSGEFQITSFAKDKNAINSGFTGLTNIKIIVTGNQMVLSANDANRSAVFSRLQ